MGYLKIKNDGPVRHIAFNRPAALNAFTPGLLKELVVALKDAEQHAQTTVVVLSGEGRAFSAGVDLKLLKDIMPKDGKVGDIFDATRPIMKETVTDTMKTKAGIVALRGLATIRRLNVFASSRSRISSR